MSTKLPGIDRYRVLALMARLGNFTVAELVKKSGCAEAVVGGILARHPHWLDAESTANQRPGAPTKRYSLQDKDREARIGELNVLFNEVAGPFQLTGDDDEAWPNELLAAEHRLK